MYLENGREIYESDKYPGYYIDANTGDFCDENGNYIGGNQDDGDEPGQPSDREYVFVARGGEYFYPKKGVYATIIMTLTEAKKRRYKPSPSYISYKHKELFKKKRKKL